MIRACTICGALLPPHTGRGRPRVRCSVPCAPPKMTPGPLTVHARLKEAIRALCAGEEHAARAEFKQLSLEAGILANDPRLLRHVSHLQPAAHAARRTAAQS